MDIASQKENHKAFRWRYVELRLGDTLTRAISPKDPVKDFYFLTATSHEGFYKANSPYFYSPLTTRESRRCPLFQSRDRAIVFG